MAVNLKKKKKCRIIPPRWLTLGMHFQTLIPSTVYVLTTLPADNLELMLREETRGEAFAPLPFNYMELSRILLEACALNSTAATSSD